MKPSLISEHAPLAHRLAAPLVAGFTAAVGMWVMWFITHIPAIDAPAATSAALVFATAAVGLFFARLWTHAVPGPIIGICSGLVAGLVTLVLLGSHIAEQPASVADMPNYANDLRPDALWMVLGFLGTSALLGLLADRLAFLATRHRPRPADPARSLRAVFAWTLCVAFLPVLLVGGFVTSTESGMAVPDPVTSYGAISFLFPAELMGEPRIFLEHKHRLLGSLLGLTCIAGVAVSFLLTRERWAWIASIAILLLVTLQGIFGIIRVGENLQWMAALHGVFAQIVFAIAVAFAVFTSPAPDNLPTARTIRTAFQARGWTLAVTHILFVQLLLGALSRHMNSGHALATHVANAVVVFLLIMIAAAVMSRAENLSSVGRSMRRLAAALFGITGVQIMLGVVALVFVGTGEAPPIPLADQLATAQPIRPLEAAFTTAHQTTGALLLAVSAAGWALCVRVARESRATQPMKHSDSRSESSTLGQPAMQAAGVR